MKKLLSLLAMVMMIPAVMPDQAKAAAPRVAQAKADGPVKKLDGWRSLKFGMSEKAVRAALKKEFGLSSKQIQEGENRTQKTKLLLAEVEKLPPGVGKAQILMIFGYKSKSLIKTEIIWQKPLEDVAGAAALQDAAPQLRDYFLKQNYDPASIVRDIRVNDEGILFFRGRGQNKNMVTLTLSRVGGSKKLSEFVEKKEKPDGTIVLSLSYISNPEKADIYKIDDGSF